MMLIDWLNSLITLLAVIGAILAWIAKIRWANEYRVAKEAQIASLQQQVQFLETLSTPRLMEHVNSMKEFHELEHKSWRERNDLLQKRLDKNEAKLREKDEKIKKLIEHAPDPGDVQIPASVSVRVPEPETSYQTDLTFDRIRELFLEREELSAENHWLKLLKRSAAESLNKPKDK